MDDLFNFDLPETLIAQQPASPRDHAKLLVYDRKTKKLQDDYFYNLDKYLASGTLVVANNSKVKKCRYLFDGGKTEIFAVESVNHTTIRALVRPGKKFKLGIEVYLGEGLRGRVGAVDDHGIRTITFNTDLSDVRLISATHVPLPPYIAQNDSLAEEYQTIYAKNVGSLAAPTAGLHFTPKLKSTIAKNFGWAELTLEIGLGTFSPLSEENFVSQTLHSERYEIPADTMDRLSTSKHVTAVGTTTLRSIETAFSRPGIHSKGTTDIFITPGYEFKRADALITNFHLPSTSLLLLVEAFLGSRTELARIYEHAIGRSYRFYSFGDAMLIL